MRARPYVLILLLGACGGRATDTRAGSEPGAGTGGIAGVGGHSGSAGAGGLPDHGSGGSDPDPGASFADDGLLWRETESPVCLALREEISLGLWSDERGVYAQFNPWAPESTVFNDGSGWRLIDFPQYRLTGFRGGALVGYGGREAPTPCTIEFFKDGEVECSGTPKTVWRLHTVNESLAYAVYDDRLLAFDGEHWTQLGTELPKAPGATSSFAFALAVWGDETVALVAGGQGGLYIIDVATGQHAPQELMWDVQARAVWGRNSNDLWAGTLEGELYRFDGQRWELLWSAPPDECAAISALWGTQDALFFLTGNALRVVRGVGEVVETLAEVPCSSAPGARRFTGLWGNSNSEVFFGVRDPAAACSLEMVWYDGEVLGRL